MIGNHMNIQQKSTIKRSQILESNQNLVINQSNSMHNQYMNLKKSSVNFGVMSPSFIHSKTPMASNHIPNCSSALTFSHSKQKLDIPTKQTLYQKSINEINDKIQRLTQQVMRHDIQISNLSMKNNKGQQNIQLHYGDLSNRFNPKSISTIEEITMNCQRQIAIIKKQINSSIKLDDSVSGSLSQAKFNQLIKPFQLSIHQELSKYSQKVLQDAQRDRKNVRKQLMDVIQRNYQQINRMLRRFESQLSQNNKIASLFTAKKSKFISLSPPTIIKYLECFEVISPQFHKININQSEILFKIDCEGYLLDQQGYYILDNRNQQIKLDKKHIEILKNNNILK